MEISEIKSRLTLATVLQHYGLKPDKNLRLHCPFHDDKTPSMQVYYKTHTAYCFSSNCKTHGKSLDVIDFIMHKENCSKHEALKKCGELIGGTAKPQTQSKPAFLQNMFTYFRNAVNNSPVAKTYLESRCLDFKKLEVGFNGGQFHHGTRKDETLIAQCLEYGLLIDKNLIGRTGEKAYNVFGKNCIVFPLKNKSNEIVSLYFRSTSNDKEQRHFYLRNRTGLYPDYPKADTKTLILTESIIDAATLLQNGERHREKGEGILALYGTNGLTEEHQQAIQVLPELEEIIFFFDGDLSGRKAVTKYAALLNELLPNIKIATVETDENEDINSLSQGHDGAIFAQLLRERKAVDDTKSFSFSTEKTGTGCEIQDKRFEFQGVGYEPPHTSNLAPNTSYPIPQLTGQAHNLTYSGTVARYTAKGLLKNPQESLKIALQVRHLQTQSDYRGKLDLYEYKHLQQIAKVAADALQLEQKEIEQELMIFTGLLEDYRESYRESKAEKPKIIIPEATITQCINFLRQPNLLDNLNERIGQSGIVGEESNRLFLFLIATSYKMPFTLHALIQGSSGSGKTRLMQTISRLMPPEDTKSFTRVTDSSFYNYGEYDLENKLLCFEDIDGLKEEALLALRELQSNDILISSTSLKDDNGKISSGERIVRGPIASLSATTRGDYYEDNISRSFVIAVDESPEQTNRVIEYQNKKAAGDIDSDREHEIRNFIQNCVRLLKPLEVVNPYASKIRLPRQVHKIRRLNEMYQSIVKQIVILHQYQRRQDKQGKLVAQKEDLQHACEILFESIVLKVDELEGDLRQFFEQLKQYVQQRSTSENKPVEEIKFNRFEIRSITGTGKTQQHRYIQRLLDLEYLQQYGYANRGYTYRISLWDNMLQIRQSIKNELTTQMSSITN